ncbi:MAG TPA: hypothetical protein VKK79_06665 [Candidatus Lokiarchaeia archaeon]|nr:hypothetical protein [Candidatus Lokiarchaeia archaeon]
MRKPELEGEQLGTAAAVSAAEAPTCDECGLGPAKPVTVCYPKTGGSHEYVEELHYFCSNQCASHYLRKSGHINKFA